MRNDYSNEVMQKTIDPITISHTDLIGKVLKPNDEVELVVQANYNESTINIKKNVKYQLSLITATPEE